MVRMAFFTTFTFSSLRSMLRFAISFSSNSMSRLLGGRRKKSKGKVVLWASDGSLGSTRKGKSGSMSGAWSWRWGKVRDCTCLVCQQTILDTFNQPPRNPLSRLVLQIPLFYSIRAPLSLSGVAPPDNGVNLAKLAVSLRILLTSQLAVNTATILVKYLEQDRKRP